MVNDIAVQEFVNAIKDTPTDPNTTYTATVSRVDDEGVVWVNLQGSKKETPTASTSSEVQRGDVVTVQWRNNRLYIGGNYTNPAAGFYSVQPSVDFVSELIDKDITVNSINAATGYIGELTSEKITAKDLTADHAMIKELDVESMSAAVAYIGDLTAEHITAEDIVADHATIDDLDVNYAQINGANINTATIRNNWVNQLMVQTGLIASEGAIYYLDAIKVNATNITAGTIDVERLIVTVDGEKYLVHIDPTTSQPSYEKLDGDVIEDLTITADKIVAGAITAEKITTENIVGSGGWINLRNGTFNYTNATSGNYITWDGTNLNISATNISLGSQSLSTTLSQLQDEIDGAIETWYYSVDPTLSNAPASSWTTDDAKNTHLRDLYFNTTNGHSFRWAIVQTSDTSIVSGKTYYTYNSSTGLYTAVANPTASGLPQYYEFEWVQIEDADAIKALADAAAAQETADGAEALAGTKRRVFVTTPTPPYDIGDLWAEGSTGDLKKCKTAKTTGQSYSASDWELATKYTDDSNVYTKSDFSITPEQIIGKVTKTELNLTGQYATCSTAQGTAAKVAVIQPNITGWEIYTGATITVKFTNANTASSPTLNVKGKSSDTGSAKAIKTYSGGNLSEAEYKWKAGDTFTFTYNGTNWLMQDATVATRMTSAESSITQNAENIELKVSKDGVIASINASTETSGGSAVTINADKVNIAGAALFTSGRLSESSLNAAYDANGAAATAESNAKTYADTGIISTTTLYYASSSTTAPSKPSAHVTTSSASTYGAWNLTLPTYSATYPYLYVCTETKTKGGTYGWTSVEQTTYASAISSIKSTADAAAPKTSAVSEEQYIYKSAVSGTSSMSGTTTWITSTSDSQNAWTTKRPTYSSSYPVLFVAKQKKTVSGTVTCTTPVKDDTTTIIDGGHITTGTIDASVATITNIDATKITVNKIQASQINTGSITVGSLSDGSNYSTTSQMNTAIGNAVDGIDVGGRNILVGTATSVSKATTATSGYVTQSLYYTPFKKTLSELGYKVGDKITLSFDWKITSATTYGNARIEWYGYKDSSNTDTYLAALINPFATFSASNTSGHVETTVTLTSTTVNAKRLVMRIDNSDLTVTISNLKLEKGNKATAWSQAPEDIVNDNLLIDSQKMGSWQIGANASLDSSGEFGVATITGDTNWTGLIYSKPTISASTLDGSPLWLSFEYQYSEATAIAVSLAGTSAAVESTTSITRTRYLTKWPVLESKSAWTKYSIQMPSTLAELTSGSGDVNSLVVQFYNYYTANSTLKIRKVKLEHGIGSTDWTPSPQDQKAYITRISNTGIQIHPANSSGNNYAQIDGSNIQFFRNGQSMTGMNNTDVRIGRNDAQHVRINSSGMTVYKGSETTANNVANYSDTVRIGREDSYKTLISSEGIQLVDGTGSNGFSLSTSGQTVTIPHTYTHEVFGGMFSFSADISNYTITFTLKNSSRTYQTTTKTNAQLPVGSSFVLGGTVDGYHAEGTVTRTGTSTFTFNCTYVDNTFIASWTSTQKAGKVNFSGANTILVNDVVQYMQASQTVYLSEPVSAQLNGIVLAWSAYESGAAKNWDWNYTFVPKNHVLLANGNGVGSGLMTTTGALSYVGSKYVKVYDDRIEGYAGNESSGTAKGITYNNNHWVLRYVYGV